MSEEIKKLIEGNKAFRKKFFDHDNPLFKDLVLHGQKPKVMIIACSDSRVDPAIIFDSQPGELFVVRNIANLVPAYEQSKEYSSITAALMFGVSALNIAEIIVMGHMHCAGIEALCVKGSELKDNQQTGIDQWLRIALPAYNHIMAADVQLSAQERELLCNKQSLINSISNLESFPWIKEKIESHSLKLHAWLFNLSSGTICRYDQSKNRWTSDE